jgi:hypothetical protein
MLFVISGSLCKLRVNFSLLVLVKTFPGFARNTLNSGWLAFDAFQNSFVQNRDIYQPTGKEVLSF